MKQIESALSRFSSRTSSAYTLLQFLRAQLIYNCLTMPYAMDPLLRYYRVRGYANTARTEATWIKSLCDMYGQGKAENVVFVVGDWSLTGALSWQRGAKRPAAYSRILHHLRAAGVTVLLVDEAYTSKRCSHCQSQDAECAGKDVPGVLVGHGKSRFNVLNESHGRLICSGCGAMWNRDVNACHNMLILASAQLHLGERPPHLQRSRRQASTA